MADVRIVAATNENLERAIKEGRFREDLYHRLAEMEIRMPSLAECADDILPLAEFFRERFSKELKKETKGFSKDAIYRLRSYRWPGNVRELQNRIKRAVLLTETPVLELPDLNATVRLYSDYGENSGHVAFERRKQREGSHCKCPSSVQRAS